MSGWLLGWAESARVGAGLQAAHVEQAKRHLLVVRRAGRARRRQPCLRRRALIPRQQGLRGACGGTSVQARPLGRRRRHAGGRHGDQRGGLPAVHQLSQRAQTALVRSIEWTSYMLRRGPVCACACCPSTSPPRAHC